MSRVSNKKHSELREGEVFITNIGFTRLHCPIEYGDDNRSDWDSIGWKTKRMGEVAYDIYGRPINGMRPVFVQRSEMVKAGVDPDRKL